MSIVRAEETIRQLIARSNPRYRVLGTEALHVLTAPPLPHDSNHHYRRLKRRRYRQIIRRVGTALNGLTHDQVSSTTIKCDCRYRTHFKVAVTLYGKRYGICPILLSIKLERLWLAGGHHEIDHQKLVEMSRCNSE